MTGRQRAGRTSAGRHNRTEKEDGMQMIHREKQSENRWAAALLAAVLLLSAGCGRGGTSQASGADSVSAGGELVSADVPGGGRQSAADMHGDSQQSAADMPGGGQQSTADASGETLPDAASAGEGQSAQDASGYGGQAVPDASGSGLHTNPDAFEREWRTEQQAGTKLQSMTLEQKVAQMFAVTPDTLTGVEGTTIFGDITRDALTRLPLGGLIYTRDNLQNADQTRVMLQMTQAFSEEHTGLPMLFFVDEEGGTVTRISGNEGFPEIPQISSMAVVGAGGDTEQALAVGETIGAYLSDLGFNVDLAPVADILSDPASQVIGTRSFGSDPQVVADMAAAMGTGLESQGVLACYKHFPGHGSTAADTHEGSASSNKTLEQLKECELLPFQTAIDRGARMIMVSHISLPNVIGYATPASLSPYLLKNILREQMGFEGLIITDAMNMGAVTDNYTAAEAAILAVQAGADMILMPDDLWSAYTAVVHAVQDGQIREADIDAAVSRILKVKYELAG